MTQRGPPAIYRSHVQMRMPFLWDQNERNFVVALKSFIRDHVRAHNGPASIISHCLLDAPYDGLSFLNWSGIWCNAVRLGVRYHSGADEAYFLGWHIRQICMIPPRTQPKLYVKVPGWRKKYELFRATLSPTSPLFSYVSSFFDNDSLLRKGIYPIALAKHCVMVIVTFLQWVAPTNDFTKMNLVGLDPSMPEAVYNGVLFPFRDVMIRLALEAEVRNISVRTCYSLVLALMQRFYGLRRSIVHI